MHVLHRPHQLRRATLAAVAAAVLAIVVTLAIAGGLNDLGSAPTAASAPTSRAAVDASAPSEMSNLFTDSPFTKPFAPRLRLPWASVTR